MQISIPIGKESVRSIVCPVKGYKRMAYESTAINNQKYYLCSKHRMVQKA